MKFINNVIILLVVSYGLCATINPPTTTRPRKDTAPTNTDCSYLIQKLGYKCCGAGCKIIYVDKYGNWGEKDNKWCACGGGPKCSPRIMNKRYRCCLADNCSIKASDN